MRRVIFSLAVVVLAAGWGRAGENLIRNPGFEEAPANGKPGGGWWLYEGRGSPELRQDDAISRSGRASARVQAATETKCTLVSGPFRVAPDDELRFEVWVRGESLPPDRQRVCAGLAFRQADGKVTHRTYFSSPPLGREWGVISGTARAPAGAVRAEVHLGYTNAPGVVWFDDVLAEITNPLSLSLVEAPKPWPGEQNLRVLVVNRQTNSFSGAIRPEAGQRTRPVPVVLAPGSSREVPVPLNLKGEGAHDYKLSLLDATGVALRVLKGRARTEPALVLYPACPCYHLAGEGTGETRIETRINLDPSKRAGLRLAVELTDAQGHRVAHATADASTPDTPGVSLRVPVQAAGSFGIRARLVEGAEREIATAEGKVHVAPAEESRVTVGPDGFLRVNGEPHFPVGLYSSARYEEIGRAGFSATHNYGITTGEAAEAVNPNDRELERLLDLSWANGMRMMVELPRKAVEKAQWTQVRRRIETFRHHPGLLCWGSEERVARGEAPLANVAALYQLARQADPGHPLVLGDTRDVIGKLQQDRRDFFPDACMDIGIWWWYPIPLREPDGNGLEGGAGTAGGLEPPSWLTTTISRKPLWIAIQAYQKPSKDAPFPSPAEYRCMAYLSIIHGVKGLWFYTGSGQKDFYGKSAGLLNKPVEARWDYVQKLVRELRELSPVIMAPAWTGKVTMAPAGGPVEFATRAAGGKIYLLAANKSPHPQVVRFSGVGVKGRRARVLYETREATVEEDGWKDEFGPFGAHLYVLD